MTFFGIGTDPFKEGKKNADMCVSLVFSGNVLEKRLGLYIWVHVCTCKRQSLSQKLDLQKFMINKKSVSNYSLSIPLKCDKNLACY